MDTDMNAKLSGTGLTIEDEQALGRRIQQGDGAALNALVVANRYRRDAVDTDDLIQEANIGLMLAAQRYDPERGVRFTSYAGWWIEAQLRRYIRRHASVVRVGEGTQKIVQRLRRAEERLLQEQAHVTPEMVAREAQVNLTTAQLATGGASAPTLSLDRVMGDVDSDFSLQDMVADDTAEEAFTEAEAETVLGPLLGALDTRQRQIIHMRYSENRTCTDVGEELNLSGSRVQQIEAQALRCLRRRWMFPEGPFYPNPQAAATC
jgi:RNA polymerase sigma factor (sigma-70 family)